MRGDTREAKEEAREAIRDRELERAAFEYHRAGGDGAMLNELNRGRRQAEAALCGYRVEEVPMRTDLYTRREFIVVVPDGQRHGNFPAEAAARHGNFPTEAAAWDYAWWMLQGTLRDE